MQPFVAFSRISDYNRIAKTFCYSEYFCILFRFSGRYCIWTPANLQKTILSFLPGCWSAPQASDLSQEPDWEPLPFPELPLCWVWRRLPLWAFTPSFLICSLYWERPWSAAVSPLCRLCRSPLPCSLASVSIWRSLSSPPSMEGPI